MAGQEGTRRGSIDSRNFYISSSLFASMGWNRTACAGVGQGFAGCSRCTAFRECMAQGGDHAVSLFFQKVFFKKLT